MLLDVIVQVIEGLDLLQLVDGDSNLVGCLHNGNEVYNTYTIQAESLFEARIGRELTLFYFKLFFKQAVYLINDFLSCHNFIVFFLNDTSADGCCPPQACLDECALNYYFFFFEKTEVLVDSASA